MMDWAAFIGKTFYNRRFIILSICTMTSFSGCGVNMVSCLLILIDMNRYGAAYIAEDKIMQTYT